jgi:hypothetical protein
MNETDISKVLIEGEYVTIMGVKYKRVEPPKPPTLYDTLDPYSNVDREHICSIVADWLPAEVIEDGEEYHNGWNDCIKHLKENLK